MQTHRPGSAVRRRRLVIADDSAEMRWLVRHAIGAEFREVIEAADGRALFWALLRTSIVGGEDHVIVTDLCMPTYTGLEVLAAWRDIWPRVPTILITAFPSAAVHDHARQLGAVVLAKPFSTTALREVIREVSHDHHDD